MEGIQPRNEFPLIKEVKGPGSEGDNPHLLAQRVRVRIGGAGWERRLSQMMQSRSKRPHRKWRFVPHCRDQIGNVSLPIQASRPCGQKSLQQSPLATERDTS
jgi:hypothetical protein